MLYFSLSESTLIVVVLLYSLFGILPEKKMRRNTEGKKGSSRSLFHGGVLGLTDPFFFSCRIVTSCGVFGILVILLMIAAVVWKVFTIRGKDESLREPYQIQAVATDHKVCSEKGNEILNSNGSAVEAAITVMFCLGVMNMHSSGVGGGGVRLVYNRKLKKAKFIHFRKTVPEATTSHMFPPYKTGPKDMTKRGLCPFIF